MKRRSLFYALGGLSLVAAAALAAGSRRTVSVEEAKIRSKRQFFAPAVAAVKFGDTVDVGAVEDGWYAVAFKGQRGFLHESALAGSSAKLSGGQWSGSDEAGSEEVTLAGKGFNDDVEKSYRKQHADLDYAAVDAVAKRSVSEGAMVKFMQIGGLLPKEAR